MLSKSRLWMRDFKKLIVTVVLGVIAAGAGAFATFPEWLNFRLFFSIPVFSFYPETLRAIEKLKTLPDIEYTLSGSLYVSTLKKSDVGFNNISKIIRAIYQVDKFDEMKLKRSEQFLIKIDASTNEPIYTGGIYFFEFNDKAKTKIYPGDTPFSDIRHELDKVARKRLAVLVFIFGVAATLTAIYPYNK